MKLKTFEKLVHAHVDARATEDVLAACKTYLVDKRPLAECAKQYNVQASAVNRLSHRLKGLLANATEIYKCENS